MTSVFPSAKFYTYHTLMMELVIHEQSPMDFDTIGRDTCCLQSNMYVIVALLTRREVANGANGEPQMPHKHLCLISIS